MDANLDRPGTPELSGPRRYVRRTLISGVLLLVPVVATYCILRWIFLFLDNLVQPYVRDVTDLIFGEPRSVPGMGLLAMLLIIYLLGALTANVAGRYLIVNAQRLLLRMPVVRTVYSASKHMVESMSSPLDDGRRRVVLFEVPAPGSYTIAIVTGTSRDENGRELLSLYIPTAPTPNSGYLAIATADHVLQTDLTMGQAMALVVSCGVLCPNTVIMSPHVKPK